ncbi:restriction endonuclease subunit S [Lutibacter sp.]|uniref:restriction endonuclease subunit S n=1 Tax=Lutibacter sp. TaxID=1925666 RepID=UPI0025C25BEC|nr:restriction endonuclease subunit S [Lutibacter sp.]MCF6182511.1 restriction endonuclease subunit S [Lutibacter sp.]
MEGLEAIEINYSFLNSVIDFRIESEYFDKKFLLIDEILNKKKTISFAKIATAINGRPYSSDSFNTIKGIKLSKIGDVTNRRDIEDWATVDTKEFDKQKGQFLIKGDILMTLTGDPPDVGKVNYIYNPINSSWNQRVAKIKIISDTVYINNESLFVVLSTEYSRTQLERFAKGIRQRNLGNESLERLLLPILSNDFQIKLKIIILEKYELLKDSKQSYTQAENLLLDEIGLQNFAASKEPINIKSFAASFGTSGRLDAEYYQKKYEQVVNKVKSKPFDMLSNLVDIKKSIEPGSKNYVENGLPFMRVADLSKNGLSEPQKYISDYFVKENQDKIKKLKPKKGTILFSKDGSVGIAYHLRQNYNGITSGAILHLNVKDEKRIIPEYLTLALNSKIVQMQAERDAGGSIILHWRSSEIENVVVPIIDYKKQEQIANLIEESFALKKQSEHLLEVAKKAVEIAIEENEEVALKYINQETN